MTYRHRLVARNQILGKVSHLLRQLVQPPLLRFMKTVQPAGYHRSESLHLQVSIRQDALLPFCLGQTGLDHRPQNAVSPFGFPGTFIRPKNEVSVSANQKHRLRTA